MATWNVETLNGGVSLVLGDSLLLGSGGEGAVYRMPADDSLVIKIYHPGHLDQERIDKLKAMIADPPADPMRHKGHASIAWPEDLVVSQGDGRVCGFVMPRLAAGHAVSNFFDLRFRQTKLPSVDYSSLCRIASNLASAVWAIHEKGYVIGDVNDRNIMATPDALVTIVDTDSFQIRDRNTGRVYRCPVANALFTPPEFQDVSFSQVDRSPAQDLFGVGVLLFQLLMEGQLPYACASNAGNPPDCIECLKRGYFPYAQQRSGIQPPPWAPPYEMLHPELRRLFDQCFVDGYHDADLRPDAKTWRRALKDSEQSLTRCNVNARHYYFNHCTACPWCERTQRLEAIKPGNWDPFPVNNPGAASGSPRAGTQRPISTPPPRSTVRPAAAPRSPSVVFTASATSIKPGQPITFHWTVPNAHSVRLKEKPGRVLSVHNSPSGSHTIWPTKSKAYQLLASGVNASLLPAPITISVTQPVPDDLKQISVEFHTPIDLRSTQLVLLQTLTLRQQGLRLLSPMPINDHVSLDGYQPLNEISIDLNYSPAVNQYEDALVD